ncbi:MAG TPA: F0F1 ATP synthase subunit delta [Hanamia sp.]|nr:F0F1 ATP synthase subunit delta [Hanamia sp.]
MKIDWFTVIAQVLNFLILVWLLKRFLYKPILNAIEAREKKVAGQLSDAELKMAEANKELTQYQQKNEEFDQKKKEMMGQAITESKDERQKLFEQVRQEANALQIQFQKSVKEKEENLEKEIAQKTQQEVFDISRKALGDLANTGLEEQVVKRFVLKLNELDDTVKQQISQVFNSDTTGIIVKSAFELSENQKEEIKSTFKNISGKENVYQYETSPQLISGIELSANGYKVSWSISEYLNSLEKAISEAIQEKAKQATG